MPPLTTCTGPFCPKRQARLSARLKTLAGTDDDAEVDEWIARQRATAASYQRMIAKLMSDDEKADPVLTSLELAYRHPVRKADELASIRRKAAQRAEWLLEMDGRERARALAQVPPDQRDVVAAIVPRLMADLRISAPVTVRTFAAEAARKGQDQPTGERFTVARGCTGFVSSPAPHTVWLRDGVTGKALVLTVAHELRHVFQAERVGLAVMDAHRADVERDAEQYAAGVLARLGL